MHFVPHMPRQEVARCIEAYPVAILPLGSTEQHGHHLPLGTDTLLAEDLARRVSDQTGALVFPALPFGYSWVWRDIAGTVTLPQSPYKDTLVDLVRSIARHGIRLLVFINGHEANNASIKYAIREAQDETDMKLLGMFYPGLAKTYAEHIESETWGGMFHACEFETSLMLAAHPDLVDIALAQREYPERPPFYGMDNTSIGDLSQSGVYGDPQKATKEKGEAMFQAFTHTIVDLIATATQELNLPATSL